MKSRASLFLAVLLLALSLTACGSTVAAAAPMTPSRNARMNSRSSPMFSTVENSRKMSGVVESPRLRKTEQIKL